MKFLFNASVNVSSELCNSNKFGADWIYIYSK